MCSHSHEKRHTLLSDLQDITPPRVSEAGSELPVCLVDSMNPPPAIPGSLGAGPGLFQLITFHPAYTRLIQQSGDHAEKGHRYPEKLQVSDSSELHKIRLTGTLVPGNPMADIC